jgi:hypothetical protein
VTSIQLSQWKEIPMSSHSLQLPRSNESLDGGFNRGRLLSVFLHVPFSSLPFTIDSSILTQSIVSFDSNRSQSGDWFEFPCPTTIIVCQSSLHCKETDVWSNPFAHQEGFWSSHSHRPQFTLTWNQKWWWATNSDNSGISHLNSFNFPYRQCPILCEDYKFSISLTPLKFTYQKLWAFSQQFSPTSSPHHCPSIPPLKSIL